MTETSQNQIKQIWELFTTYTESFPVNLKAFHLNKNSTYLHISKFVFSKLSMRTEYPKKDFHSLTPYYQQPFTQSISITVFWIPPDFYVKKKANHYEVRFTFHNTDLPDLVYDLKLFPVTTEPEQIASFCFRLIKCMK